MPAYRRERSASLDPVVETLMMLQTDASIRSAAEADLVLTPCFVPSSWRDFHLGSCSGTPAVRPPNSSCRTSRAGRSGRPAEEGSATGSAGGRADPRCRPLAGIRLSVGKQPSLPANAATPDRGDRDGAWSLLSKKDLLFWQREAAGRL